jgi:hypothetical protein
VNVLDENILRSQRELLRSWRIRCQHIGHDLGRPGLADDEVLAMLLRLGRATLFTRDLRLARPALCDRRLCLVTLDVGQHETASFVRRVLRHPALNTQARRLGTVVRATHTGLRVWRAKTGEPRSFSWPKSRPGGARG